MNRKTLTLLITALAWTMLGNTAACDATVVPVGDEAVTIEQAWAFQPQNTKERIDRLELVVQLQRRELDQRVASHQWMYDCFAVLSAPPPSAAWVSFAGNLEGLVIWCENTYGPGYLDYQ